MQCRSTTDLTVVVVVDAVVVREKDGTYQTQFLVFILQNPKGSLRDSAGHVRAWRVRSGTNSFERTPPLHRWAL